MTFPGKGRCSDSDRKSPKKQIIRIIANCLMYFKQSLSFLEFNIGVRVIFEINDAIIEFKNSEILDYNTMQMK